MSLSTTSKTFVSRVKVNRNNSSNSINNNKKVVDAAAALGEEAVAKENIEAGSIVINEPPLLVLPFSEEVSTVRGTSGGNSTSSGSGSSSSPAKSLLNILLEQEQKLSNKMNNEETTTTTSQEYEKHLLPSLQKAEAIAVSHGLASSYFFPLIMAHYTMSKEGIVEILDWLVSHVELVNEEALKYFASSPQQQQQGSSSKIPLIRLLLASSCRSPQEEQKKLGTFGFGPIKLHSSELAAATKIYENLESILVNDSNDDNSSPSLTLPSAPWWKQIFLDKFIKDEYNPKIAPLNNNNNNNNATKAKSTTNSKTPPSFTSDEEKFIFLVVLLKWLHGVRINVHSDDVNKLTAVFKFACKFNHSCKPNTFWYLTSSAEKRNEEKRQKQKLAQGASEREQRQEEVATSSCDEEQRNNVHLPSVRVALQSLIGNAVHVATRDIKTGEPCTFSYIGCGLNMLSPTPQRRSSLKHLNFVCACERCKAFDESIRAVAPPVNNNKTKNPQSQQQQPQQLHPEVSIRSLLCGDCFGRAQMEFHHFMQNNNNTRQQQKQKPTPPSPQQFLTLALMKNSTWKCHVCGVEPTYEDYSEILMHETKIVDQIMASFFTPFSAGGMAQQHEVRIPTNEKTPSGEIIIEVFRKKDLKDLWYALRQAATHLSMKHYISVVAVASFVSHLEDQLDFIFNVLLLDLPSKNEGHAEQTQEKYFNLLISPLLNEINSSSSSSSNNNNNNNITLFALIMKTFAWFQSTLEGSPQHVRFKVAVNNLLDLLEKVLVVGADGKTKFASSLEKLFGGENNTIEQLKTLVESSFSKDQGFLRLKEFGDMQS